MALKITINGQQRLFEDLKTGSTLNLLLEVLELKPDRIALEINGTLTPRNGWGNVTLSDDDKIEVVHFVGGG